MNQNGTYVIIDYRAHEIQLALTKLGYKVFPFSAKGLVYPAIEGHPDIFLFTDGSQWILAPNTPKEIIGIFEQKKVAFKFGHQPVGKKYPETVRYNIYIDKDVSIIHVHIDKIFEEIMTDQKIVKVTQGYVRCNVFRLGNEFITSDVHIHNALISGGFASHYVNPSEIRLFNVNHGFIGGCLGRKDSEVFFTGSRSFVFFPLIKKLCKKYNLNLTCLTHHLPLDVGGIFFI
ncbi:MAG: hypothetical protein N2Z72_02100 [Bacteroidales bacterium]|nr:hypothetical protein [Bacteroidales bacterium]